MLRYERISTYTKQRLANPGTSELTPAEMLKPSVVYESPKVNRNFVEFHANFPLTQTAKARGIMSWSIPCSMLVRCEAVQVIIRPPSYTCPQHPLIFLEFIKFEKGQLSPDRQRTGAVCWSWLGGTAWVEEIRMQFDRLCCFAVREETDRENLFRIQLRSCGRKI